MKLESLFVSSLGSVSKLRWYLDNNVNLIDYLNMMSPQMMFMVTMTTSLIPKNKLRKEIGGINSQRVLGILGKERADLYSLLLKHPNGLNWLQGEIRGFKDYFLK